MTSPPQGSTGTETTRQLEAAARASLLAPSVFNTQPWRWRITGAVMELHTDPDRRLTTTDPDGRLLMLSCGAALQHARTALAAAGWAATVERLPDASHPDLLARVRLGAALPPDPEAQMMAGAMKRRRTDRRAFGERLVPDAVLTRLRRLVETEGAYLHVVRADQMPMLAVSTEHAAAAELDDPAYRAELDRWTSRPSWTGDGVPPSTAVQSSPRRVPVRDFTPVARPGLTAGDEFDKGASYVVLFGMSDEPIDVLRGGEALSALLLKATAEGLSSAPLSDAVEVSWTRRLLRDLLTDIGEPYIAVRLGYLEAADPLPPAPRRDPAEVITIEQ
jgi:nitroreductase